ncbi:restriction system protein [Oceanisphaera litoralis]|uniref:restriction endonuclease n=1 Tax=Oceanisphaera litoralis TaxID=225144 RepID=UPI00195AF763|nr:restriction endonuclease [Oceanisphaera litoralis]MBM7454382.1 restriction system protein [Oceanisphaera litoralis]
MARRRRQSLIEDMIDIAAKLPWWLSLLLAIISYLILEHFAAGPFEVEVTPGSTVPANLTELMLRPFFMAMQFFIPLAFTFGAGLSAIKALKGRSLAQKYISISLQQPRTGSTAKPTDDMSWQQFELLVGQAFRQQGYRVIDGGEAGADGGVDVHLKKDGLTYFVQCKHWKAKSVGVSVVRELYGVIAGAGAEGGFVVTSGNFTEEAEAFARDKRISLLDGKALDDMLLHAKISLAEGALRASQHTATAVTVPPATTTPTVSCPSCSSSMVRRKARRGANAGQEFWGCSQFPKCRGTRSI